MVSIGELYWWSASCAEPKFIVVILSAVYGIGRSPAYMQCSVVSDSQKYKESKLCTKQGNKQDKIEWLLKQYKTYFPQYRSKKHEIQQQNTILMIW